MENNELDLQKIVRNINMIFVALFEDLKELVNDFKNKVNKQTISVPIKKPISNTSGILGMASRLLSGKNENFLNLLLNRKKSLKNYKEFHETLDSSIDLIINENINSSADFKKEANQFAANFYQIIQKYSKDLDQEMSRISKEIAEKLGSSDTSPDDVIKAAYEKQNSGKIDSMGNIVNTSTNLEFDSEQDEIDFYEALFHYVVGEYDPEDFEELSPNTRKIFELNKSKAEEILKKAPQKIVSHLKKHFAS